jgi:hypothetical protein
VTGGGAKENEGAAVGGGVGTGVGAKCTFFSNQLGCVRSGTTGAGT